jgi:serine acetyltransferase
MSGTGLGELLREDAAANRGNPKGLFVVASYRVAHAVQARGPRWLALPVVILHRLLSEGLLGIELPAGATIGPRLEVWHGTGLVVHAGAELGADVTLRHCSTIGTVGEGRHESAAPTIGDRVNIGASALVLGPITVGDGAVIGAGAVVLHDVPAGATVVGNPARVVGGSDR